MNGSAPKGEHATQAGGEAFSLDRETRDRLNIIHEKVMFLGDIAHATRNLSDDGINGFAWILDGIAKDIERVKGVLHE